MGAKNSRHNKEEEKKTESSAPDRGHTYDVVEEDDFIKNREEEEKRKQIAEIVKNALESKESQEDPSPSYSSNRPRIHPYDNVVVDGDKTEEQSPTTTEEDKDAIKINTKAKDKKVKKEEKKEEQKKKEDKKKEKRKEVKELPPIIVLPVAPVAPVVPAVDEPEDVEYTNVTAIKKAEESKENEMTTEDGTVYALPVKTKKKEKKRESNETECKISVEPQSAKELNYIQVEILPKSPASPKQELKSPKKHETLTYSNIIRENGKIVLVPEQ